MRKNSFVTIQSMQTITNFRYISPMPRYFVSSNEKLNGFLLIKPKKSINFPTFRF
jgi:hypothetical protein